MKRLLNLFRKWSKDKKVNEQITISAPSIDDNKSKGDNNFWKKSGDKFLASIILHAIEICKKENRKPSYIFVAGMLFKDNIFQDMAKSENEVVASCGGEMLNKSENERQGIISTATIFLDLSKNEIFANLGVAQ